MRCSAVYIVAALAAGCAAQTAFVPWPVPSATPLNITMGYGTVKSTGTRFNWYTVVLDDLSRFRVFLPNDTCAVRAGTTATAVEHGCVVGMNAGYFQFSPNPTYCLGDLVVNGVVEQWAGDGEPMFSVSASARTTIAGPLTKAQVATYNVSYGVAGFAMIVFNGSANPASIERSWELRARVAAARGRTHTRTRVGAEEIAPRSVLSLDAQGRLLLTAIDGVESLDLGVTVPELTEIFASGAPGFPFAARYALELDGGGSTTLSASPLWPFPAQIYNRPTDTDLGPISERLVTSIACILP